MQTPPKRVKKTVKTATLFNRNIKLINKKFAIKEAKAKGYRSTSAWVDALLDEARKTANKRSN